MKNLFCHALSIFVSQSFIPTPLFLSFHFQWAIQIALYARLILSVILCHLNVQFHFTSFVVFLHHDYFKIMFMASWLLQAWSRFYRFSYTSTGTNLFSWYFHLRVYNKSSENVSAAIIITVTSVNEYYVSVSSCEKKNKGVKRISKWLELKLTRIKRIWIELYYWDSTAVQWYPVLRFLCV